jgi:hypothetical protein
MFSSHALSISVELAITSFGKNLELLLLRHPRIGRNLLPQYVLVGFAMGDHLGKPMKISVGKYLDGL